MLQGVSTGIKTSGKKTILDGGVFKDDVALHFVIGQPDKGEVYRPREMNTSLTSSESDSIPTVSGAIGTLRRTLIDNASKDNVYGQAANGSLPIVAHVENKVKHSSVTSP